MASSIAVEFGVTPARAQGSAQGSRKGSARRASRSSAAGGAAESSVSRVRVHGAAPEELSIAIAGGEHAAAEEEEEEERKAGPPAASSVLPTPTGYGSAEDGDEALGALKSDSARSQKSVALLRDLDALLLPASVVEDPRLSKGVRAFYEEQNELVEGYKSIVRLEDAETAAEKEAAEAATEKQSGLVKFAIEASLANTFLLILLKFIAAIWSGSISIIASAVDSALDVVSQSTLVATARFMHKKDPVKFPIGKSRMENLSVLVFSVIMSLAAVFLLYQSLLVLVDGLQNTPEIRIDALSISVLGTSIVIQIFAHIFCRWVANRGGRGSAAVAAVAEDHLNDVCANSLAMTAALIAGFENSAWFADPIGGILIALYILGRWSTTCHEQFMLLLGQSASREFLCKLTYMAANFDPRILKVDTVLAYQLGAKFHCEVHIVLPADMPLRVAHDIGEALEQNIEKVDDVELAWVHLDFEWSHVAEHRRWDL